MSNKCCPKCRRVLTDYEISSHWCSACNNKFENAIDQQEITEGNEMSENNIGVESSASYNHTGMSSASTLRNCSTMITVLMIIGAIILLCLCFSKEEFIFLIISIPAIFIAIIQNALLKGIADIIDNTYETKLSLEKALRIMSDSKSQN